MIRAHAVVSLALSIVACGGGDRDAEGRASEPVPTVAVSAAPRVELPAIYDDEGNLRASDVRVAGLTLPMGLISSGEQDRLHTYLSDVPIARLLRYFGPRLTTGQVEERPGGGACYRAATAREAEGSTVHMDVTITPVPGSRVLIEVREIAPPPTNPPSEAESIRTLESAMHTAE